MNLFTIQAQTVTVGSGQNLNSIYEASPVNIYYRRQISQMIYTVAELNSAGIFLSGDINKIGFYIENVPVYAIPGYTISMMHTVSTNVITPINTVGIQTVKSPFTYLPAGGQWDMINLDNPFNWNGTDNILIEICWSQITPTYDASGQCRVFSSLDGYRYNRDDNAGDICGGTTTNVLDVKPQIRFTFEENTIWTGSFSNEWGNSLNWTSGVPDYSMDAIISSNSLNFPEINDSVVCNSLINESTVVMSSSGHLNLYGDFVNNGVFEDGEGKMSFRGDLVSSINNQGSLELYDLDINNSESVNVIGNEVAIKGTLNVIESSFNTNDLVILKSDINGTARIGELKSNCNFTINAFDSYGDGWNGGYLELYINGVLTETFSAGGFGSVFNFQIEKGSLFELYYFSGSWENENSYELLDQDNGLVFSDGTSPNVGLVYGDVANCQFIDLINGEVSVERYIDPGATNWRNIGSGVRGATIEQFNDDFTTAGYPGSLFPNFPFISSYRYEETLSNSQGYLAPIGSDMLENGQGWQIYCGDSLQGTNSFVFDLKGVPNQGPIELPVSYTPTTDGMDGWCLVANPYASAIDWDATQWVKVNVGGAIYILNPDTDQYTTYVNGASANGGSPFVASQQSFWVRTFGSSPILTADEGVKFNSDQPFMKASNLSQGMSIKIIGDSSYDEIVIRHLDHAQDEFEYEVDAQKYWNPSSDDPQISVINGEQKDLSIHSFNKGLSEWSFPLRTLVSADGNYQLQFNNTQELNVPCMFVEDLYTNTSYLVSEGVSYNFIMLDTSVVPRFVLHIGRNYRPQTIDNKCSADQQGMFWVDLDTTMISYEISNLDGFYEASVGNANPLVINDLHTGSYYLEIIGTNDLCGVIDFNFIINEPTPIQSNANISPVIQGGDASIELTTQGGIPPYVFEWLHGPVNDSIYNLSEGNYQVNIYDSNHCLSVVNYTVNTILDMDKKENDIIMFYDPINDIIHLSGIEINDNETIKLIDINGRETSLTLNSLGLNNYSVKVPEIPTGVYCMFSTTNQNVVLRFVKQ